MKNLIIRKNHGLIAAALLGCLLCGIAHAQTWDYRWNGSGATTYWERTDGWLDSSGTLTTSYPNGEGIYAYVSKTSALGAYQYITLSGQITLGRLDIGNIGSAKRFTIQDGTTTGAGYLYFTAYDGGNAQINELAGISMGDVISTAIKLGASLDISNASSYTLSLSGTLSSATAGQKAVTLTSGKAYIGSLEDGAGTVSLAVNGSLLTLANIAYTGNTYIGSTSTLALSLESTLSYNGVISGAGTLVKSGGGHLSLTADNTYTGDTIIQAGAIKITSEANLGSGGKLIFNPTAWAQLEFLASTTLSRNVEFNGSIFSRIGAASGITATMAGEITGDGGLYKAYEGTLALTGSGSFTRGVTVASGTLIVNGDFSAATGYMIVVSTASLQGSGSYGGEAQLNGTVTPNGALTLGTTTLSSLSSLVVTLDKSGSTAIADHLNVNGSVTIGSTGANLNLSTASGADPITLGDIFYLIVNDGEDTVSGQFYSLNGVASDLSEGATFEYDGATFQITYLADSATDAFTGGNDVALMVTAIPEPAAAAALLGAMALALAARRRARR